MRDVICIDSTDHCPCFITLEINSMKITKEPKKLSFRLINDETRAKFTNELGNYDWNSIVSDDEDSVKTIIYTSNHIFCESFLKKLSL